MQTVAEIIIQQLGGAHFVVLTGASYFSQTENSVSFHIPRNGSKANRVTITLDRGHDAYTFQFLRYDPKTCKVSVVAEAEQMYCDQLADYFTSITGLYTTLGRVS